MSISYIHKSIMIFRLKDIAANKLKGRSRFLMRDSVGLKGLVFLDLNTHLLCRLTRRT